MVQFQILVAEYSISEFCSHLCPTDSRWVGDEEDLLANALQVLNIPERLSNLFLTVPQNTIAIEEEVFKFVGQLFQGEPVYVFDLLFLNILLNFLHI